MELMCLTKILATSDSTFPASQLVSKCEPSYLKFQLKFDSQS